MGKTSEPKITESRGDDYTCITFYPDLSKFKMESLDKDTVDIFTRRAYDIAAACKGVKVVLNGKRIAVSYLCTFRNLLNTFPTFFFIRIFYHVVISI